MGRFGQFDDLSMYEGTKECVLCKKEAIKTILGDHWKCKECDHVFNADGSNTDVKCLCKVCLTASKKANKKEQKQVLKVLKKFEKAIKKALAEKEPEEK
jgi:ribosomal protein L37AE/L43A